jgi:hypothetical protein
MERLKRAVAHEYDQKLEDLKAFNQRALEDMRGTRAEQEAYRSMALSLLTTTRSSTLERRVSAIDQLWKSLQVLRNEMPYYIGVLDTIGFRINMLGQTAIADLKKANFLHALEAGLSSNAEVVRTRPFLGDSLFSLYWAAQAIVGRAITTTISSYQSGEFRLWYEEMDTIELLSSVLSPAELDTFVALKHGKLDWLIRQIESKVVLEIQNELSGQPAAQQALVQANRIIEATTLLQNKNCQP